ncbi:malate dehydrogenase (NAD) [Propionispira arboris]|uniref:L-lactate dehydrogenase n=1 Tax=Propionispira arboris TaxID=84035 RepID=A0A1H7BZS1_9FIRM|nr:malate dehydrogenase [Propionispira arboris]SEJ80222.1 malate dehydrogenase (NAD) [Propionispira arboris]
MKISVIGAGNVGATAANVIACRNLVDQLVLLDIKAGIAEGKAMDMMQTAHLLGIDTHIEGVTGDYPQTANSNLIIITSGMARRPGMSREELISINAGIVKDVMQQCLKHSPDAIFLIISNPADTLTYLAIKETGLPRHRVIGMSGLLDSSRFGYFLSKALNCPPLDVDAMVIGVHGDFMLPLTRFAHYRGIPVEQLLSPAIIQKAELDTKVGGGTLTQLLGTSAWYAPGATAAMMAEAILRDSQKMISCIVLMEGEYEENDVCAAVPVILGKNGMERVVELRLNSEEKKLFGKSIESARRTNNAMKDVLRKTI